MQEEATKLGAPIIEGCEIDCDCKGIDVLPLLSPAATDSRLGPQQRLKLNGSAKFAGRVTPALESAGNADELAAPSFSGEPAARKALIVRPAELVACHGRHHTLAPVMPRVSYRLRQLGDSSH